MTIVQLTFPDPDGSFYDNAIHCSSRAQAIEYGVLVDVTDVAQQVGFRHPVAITCALDDRLQPHHYEPDQDYEARLWDVLWVAALTARLNDHETDSFFFTVSQQEINPKTGQPQKIDRRIQAVCCPGDEGEQVITIGFPQDF